ncbi:transmembrane protein 170B isoform X1 [Phocoena sinus]|uniref:transmembrane protein 170B isoform X1 n=1 Tax=Phocoena sinus TaxID=42100 RepID=UPI0013C3F53E|nr:transmembrane protein 170B isoform X1 [Phocoena sinus]
MSPRRGGGCLGDALSGPPRRPVGGSNSDQPGDPKPPPAAAAWRSRAPAAAPGASQPPQPPGAGGEGGGRPPGKMKAEGGDHSMINLSVQQVLSLWAHGTVLRNLTEMWYWIFLWALFSSLFVHGAAGVLMFVMLQRHRQGRVISVIAVSIGFLASVTGAMITSYYKILNIAPCTIQCSSRWHLQSGREEHGPLGSTGVGRWTDRTDINHLLFKDSRHTLRFLWACLTSHKEADVQIL